MSRTAYYSLARRPSVLPNTIHALAQALDVRTIDLLDDDPPADQLARARLREAVKICQISPAASFENVWHTLCLLDELPIERLNRSLTRGRPGAIHR